MTPTLPNVNGFELKVSIKDESDHFNKKWALYPHSII